MCDFKFGHFQIPWIETTVF